MIIYPRLAAIPIALLLIGAQAAPTQPNADQRLAQAIDAFRSASLAYDPSNASSWDMPDNNRGWPDRSPSGLSRLRSANTKVLAQLREISPAKLSTDRLRLRRAMLLERLDADLGAGVCRFELWQQVNHLNGWHRDVAETALAQPVATARERADALHRWRNLGRLADQEIANARRGLDAGYSSPRSVVRRVIAQVDKLAAPDAKSPLYSPAARAGDPQFQRQFRALADGPVRAKMAAYAHFLRTEYLPRARTERAISTNPRGEECYRASYRAYTFLPWSPEQILARGQALVATNKADAIRLGSALFGTSDLEAIITKVEAAPDNRFASEEELVAFTKSFVERSQAASAKLVERPPAQQLIVETLPAFQRGTGATASYRSEDDPTRPAVFRLPSERWNVETRGRAEVLAAHEGYPGHHLQIASMIALRLHSFDRLGRNAAYSEGWGRYSEQLAEEAGLYATPYASIMRRLWPGRGMVADVALHAFGWPTERLLAFLAESGRYRGTEGEELLDRIAVWPGQAAAYDSGGIELLALREEARVALGQCFDLAVFHQRVLESGSIPLAVLRQRVESWLKSAAACPSRR